MVEVFGVGGYALEGAGQLGLLEAFAGCVVMAVALKDAPGVRKAGEVGAVHAVGFFFGQGEALLGELNGWSHDFGQA